MPNDLIPDHYVDELHGALRERWLYKISAEDLCRVAAGDIPGRSLLLHPLDIPYRILAVLQPEDRVSVRTSDEEWLSLHRLRTVWLTVLPEDRGHLILRSQNDPT